jgi:dGTPase
MLRTASDHLLWERQHLARYAEKGGNSRGRIHFEPEHPYRSPFERDRDRIIHSRSFRRLEAKTQVFVKHPGQPYRTGLTHTLEVSQISRSVAHALLLNEDLTEVIALSHDLGHPPFGHAGERVLNELCEDEGGFDHNRQSLRIADTLEGRYAAFPGLNLSWEVREGLGKHGSGRTAITDQFQEFPQPSLEAQTVDLCDEIAYNNHDIDDGLASGLLSLSQVLDELPFWRDAWDRTLTLWPDAPVHVRVGETARLLIDLQITDMMKATDERLRRLKIESPDHARSIPKPLADFSPKMASNHKREREFLYRALYRHPEVMRANDEAAQALRFLHREMAEDRLPLTLSFFNWEEGESKERRIIDELASMTDDQALTLSESMGATAVF